jgi:pyruvate dehydrogenase E1 component beta subunit
MPELKYFAAVSAALGAEMDRDPSVVLMGEDVGAPSGIFAQYRGLAEAHGPHRVFDTPAGELGFLGAAVGMAMTGMRPVVEISFADFFAVCLDQLVNQAAKIRYMSGGQVGVPLTVVTFGGGGLAAGPQHSGMYDALLSAIPGLRVVAPATPGDVMGLLPTAVRDDDPTVVILHKGLLQKREQVPEDPEPIPFGSPRRISSGDAATVVSWSAAAGVVATAAERLAAAGIDVDAFDLRSLQPIGYGPLEESLRRTGRCLVVHEGPVVGGLGGEIAAQLQARCFDFLDAPVGRLGGPFTPVPFAPALEREHRPDASAVERAVKELVA